jgi:hypothetical protein
LQLDVEKVVGPKVRKKMATQEKSHIGPLENPFKAKRWFWVKKGHLLQSLLGFLLSVADVW